MFKKIADETPMTSLGQLCKFVIFYYMRFINEDIGQLRDEVLQWWEMGSPAYGVADPEELAGPLRLWDFVKFAFKGSRLARLALVILSIVTNTATYERLFSELAQIHTARRNCLKPDKVKKLSIIRQAIRKKNAIELQNQEVSASMHGRIIEAKERKIVGVVDDGDQENAVDIRMEEERVEQKEDDQEQDGEEEKEKNLWKSRSTMSYSNGAASWGWAWVKRTRMTMRGLRLLRKDKYVCCGRRETSQTGHKRPPPPSSLACMPRKCLWGSYLKA
jgi:hypothetical protein